MKKTALFLTLFFFISLAGAGAAPRSESTPEPAMQIMDLAIPDTLGKIEGRFAGTSDRWVLVIQDIHAHLTAQENIAGIVDHLNQLYGIETFAIEGGWTKTKLLKSNHLPNSQAKQQLARSLLEEAYLTGPAYSGLFSPAPLKLIGIENKKLYMENREAFLAHMGQRDNSLEKITAVEKEISGLKKSVFNPELLNFDVSLSLFREGKKAGVFLPALVETLSRLNIDFSDLDQIALFVEIMRAQKEIDTEKLKSEAERLMKFAGDPRLSFEEVLRSGKIAEPQLARYPEAVKFRSALQLMDALSHHAFFDQIEKSIGRVKEKLIKTDAEKQLDARAERFALAKKILNLEAIPSDIKKAAKEITALRKELGAAGLRKDFNKSARFYRFAKQRDAVFFKNITTQPLLAGNIAMVAGGFHTEGVTARLEKEGISYMIITPNLGENAEPADHDLYVQRMSENLFETRPSKETLAQYAVFLRGIFDKKAFADGIRVLEETRNLSQARMAVLKALETDGGKTAARSGDPGVQITVEKFMALDEAGQRKKVEGWLDEIKLSKMPVALGIRTSTLKKILEESAGWTYWKNYIIPDRLMTLGEFQDTEDVLVEPFIGMRRQPFRIKMEIAGAPGAAEIAQLKKSGKNAAVAIIDADYAAGEESLLVLPARAASFMAARLLLENRISGKVSVDFLQKIEDILTDIFTAQGILETSA